MDLDFLIGIIKFGMLDMDFKLYYGGYIYRYI